MANKNSGRKIAIAVVSIVVVAVIAYSVFPYVASTKIKDLQNNQTAYVHGTVGSRVSIGSFSAFNITDGSGSILIIWNGTLPSPGSKVLVHGHVSEYNILLTKYVVMDNASVYSWPF